MRSPPNTGTPLRSRKDDTCPLGYWAPLNPQVDIVTQITYTFCIMYSISVMSAKQYETVMTIILDYEDMDHQFRVIIRARPLEYGCLDGCLAIVTY